MKLSSSAGFLFAILAVALVSSQAFARSGSDVTQFGHDIRIEADQRVGDLTCFACSVYLRGQVSGDVTTFGGNVVLEDGGMIAGEITSFWGDVRAGDDAKISGDVTVMGGRLRRQPSTMIGGEITVFQSHGLVWLMVLSPFVVLTGIIVLIIWLVRRNRRPASVMARAA